MWVIRARPKGQAALALCAPVSNSGLGWAPGAFQLACMRGGAPQRAPQITRSAAVQGKHALHWGELSCSLLSAGKAGTAEREAGQAAF